MPGCLGNQIKKRDPCCNAVFILCCIRSRDLKKRAFTELLRSSSQGLSHWRPCCSSCFPETTQEHSSCGMLPFGQSSTTEKQQQASISHAPRILLEIRLWKTWSLGSRHSLSQPLLSPALELCPQLPPWGFTRICHFFGCKVGVSLQGTTKPYYIQS